MTATQPLPSPPSNARRLRVAILYQLPESWANVRSVWDAMRDDPEIEPIVVLLPFEHRDYQWSRENAARQLDALGVPWQAWDGIDPATASFDAVLFTSPYDETRPAAYRFAALSKHVRFTGYIPYGLEVGGGSVNLFHQYGQAVTLHASAVFVRSNGARQMYERHCASGAGHVVVTGHPRMDAMSKLDEFAIDPTLLAQIGQRSAVLWNAHFSFDADQWSTFDQLAMPILEEFAARPDLALLFRPHPLLWKKLVNLGVYDDEGVAALRRELQAMGVVIDERADHRHAFAASSALMTDAGSFLMEYFVTGKPVLYLANPQGLGLNEEGRAVSRHYDVAADADAIGSFLDSLEQRPSDEQARRHNAIPEFFAGFDGGAGRRVLEHIKTRLAA